MLKLLALLSLALSLVPPPGCATPSHSARSGANLVIRGGTLIVNLPGQPKAIRECLDAVFPAIPYCIDLIGGPFLEGNDAVVQVFRPKKK